MQTVLTLAVFALPPALLRLSFKAEPDNRKQEEDVEACDFFGTGLRVTPLLLLAASLALWVTLRLL